MKLLLQPAFNRCLIVNTSNSQSRIYPWHEPAWQRLQKRIASGRLAHGLLLIGPAGSGADVFSRRLAASLLGADTDDRQVLIDAGSHPDLLILQPEETGKAIKVDAVRELIEFVSLTAQYGSRKVALILNAEAMNRHSANMLLKTLEEPPPQSSLILVSHQPALLPITIRSRCQQVDLTPVAGAETENWLRQQLNDPEADAGLLLAVAGQAPLAACELSGEQGLPLRDRLVKDLAELQATRIDTVSTAEQWNKIGAVAVYGWLYRLTSDLVRAAVLGSRAVVNRDVAERLTSLTSGMSLRQVINYHDLVIKNYHLLTGSTNPNSAVLLEDFILHWQGVVETRQT